MLYKSILTTYRRNFTSMKSRCLKSGKVQISQGRLKYYFVRWKNKQQELTGRPNNTVVATAPIRASAKNPDRNNVDSFDRILSVADCTVFN